MHYEHIELEQRGPICQVWMNRPEMRNALNEGLIAELTHVFNGLSHDPQVRVIVLGGRGSAFCAGADLNWMKRMSQASYEENVQDAARLAHMLQAVDQCSKPVVARVHGPAFAGGMGLVAACDVVVAEPQVQFCLSEVRIGLVPATISPYVVRALGVQACRRYMLTAERLDARHAHQLGFVHEVCEPGAIDDTVAQFTRHLSAGGPESLHQTKKIIHTVASATDDQALRQHTIELIASVRASPEGREGITSFLEKRPAAWTKNTHNT